MRLKVIVVVLLLVGLIVTPMGAQEEEVVIESGWMEFRQGSESYWYWYWLNADVMGHAIEYSADSIWTILQEAGVGPEVDFGEQGVFEPEEGDILVYNDLVLEIEGLCIWVAWHFELADEFVFVLRDDEPCGDEFHPNLGTFVVYADEAEEFFAIDRFIHPYRYD
ncbi:MAG: hypothetical protein UV74_C0002G0079 [Candidatus Woesebacteria bacterium GW2011_GWB1_43_14]|uniref:Uncharacterized protein n=1 Tax=Candidatus Woesebacteria bacterium GW2011_GWB1_43_14 TaxID=1618578 RepID=A0A0G1GJB1_9BACT|nr:MAG: hypothetical protein UV51_C0004G0028 [Candidatus Woesebacteria bacterium GW2011_GWC1_42_9]KKS98858.1 MAG: hypothetical protein UV74_C0002G0079 [Candidatus Woesebacteria bacterium GW2011_GWB1_43_14]